MFSCRISCVVIFQISVWTKSNFQALLKQRCNSMGLFTKVHFFSNVSLSKEFHRVSEFWLHTSINRIVWFWIFRKISNICCKDFEICFFFLSKCRWIYLRRNFWKPSKSIFYFEYKKINFVEWHGQWWISWHHTWKLPSWRRRCVSLILVWIAKIHVIPIMSKRKWNQSLIYLTGGMERWRRNSEKSTMRNVNIFKEKKSARLNSPTRRTSAGMPSFLATGAVWLERSVRQGMKRPFFGKKSSRVTPGVYVDSHSIIHF